MEITITHPDQTKSVIYRSKNDLDHLEFHVLTGETVEEAKKKYENFVFKPSENETGPKMVIFIVDGDLVELDK